MREIRTPWRAVAAIFALNGGLFGIWASRIPAVADRHALDPAALGLLLLLLAAGAIIAFPLAGRAADRFGAARVTLWLIVVYTFALLLIALAPTITAVALALMLFGAMHGGSDVTMNAWGAEVERHLGRPVMSSFHAMWSLGAGLGAGTGFLAVTAGLGITAHFVAAGLPLALFCIWLASIDWTSDRHQPTTRPPVFALPRGGLIGVGVMAFCAALGEGSVADWSAIYLVLTTGVSEARAALGYAAFSLAMVVMRLLGDRVVLKLGPVRSARLAGTFAALGALVVFLSGGFWMAIAGFVLMGVGYAVVMPLAFSRAANDPDVSPGTGIAGMATFGYGGMLLGPPVIGFVAEATSMHTAFLLLVAISALIAVFAGSVRPPRPQVVGAAAAP
ncbi:MAG: MFS transporter [Pseudomonadota bacterium]